MSLSIIHIKACNIYNLWTVFFNIGFYFLSIKWHKTLVCWLQTLAIKGLIAANAKSTRPLKLLPFFSKWAIFQSHLLLCTKSRNLQTHLFSLPSSTQVTAWLEYWWAPHWVSIKQLFLSNFPLWLLHPSIIFSLSSWPQAQLGHKRKGWGEDQEPCCTELEAR